MAQKRMYFPNLGEYYNDCLKIEAAIKNNTVAGEAASLLRAKLMERKEFRKEMVTYLAERRNIPFQEMWDLILSGGYVPSAGELESFQSKNET